MRALSFSIALTLLFLGSGFSETREQDAANRPAQTPESPRAESARLSGTVKELYKQGKYDEALPLAKRVLEIEQAIGPDEPSVAIALSNLGEIYVQKRNNGEAEKLFQKALLIYQKHQLKTSAASNTLERLAQFAFKRRKYEEAARFLEGSLAIREASFGKQSIQVSETLHEIANVHQANRKQDQAELFYLRSIKIKEQVLGKTAASTISAMRDYACFSIKNRPLTPPSKTKEDDTRDLSDAEIEERSIRTRASCWLYGFETDCQTKGHKRPQNPLAILNGKALKLAQPPYPYQARQKRLAGLVYVAIRIDESGNVIAAKPVCGGHGELNAAGLEAAYSSKFTPTLVAGRAVTVQGLIIYNFVAQ